MQGNEVQTRREISRMAASSLDVLNLPFLLSSHWTLPMCLVFTALVWYGFCCLSTNARQHLVLLLPGLPFLFASLNVIDIPEGVSGTHAGLLFLLLYQKIKRWITVTCLLNSSGRRCCLSFQLMHLSQLYTFEGGCDA